MSVILPKHGANEAGTREDTAARVDAGARERLLLRVPAEERRIVAAGIPTAALEGGEGPPIVLLHGPGEHAGKWLRVFPMLARIHRVIAPDLPGHGASEAGGALDARQMIAWLDDLIEQACTTPPALVGQIVGGAIAARYAAQHGDRIAQLVLVDSLGLAPFEPAPEFGAALMAFVAQPSAETHDGLWQQCAFDFQALRKDMGSDWDRLKAYNLDRAADEGHRAALHRLMEQFGFPAIDPAELSRIAVPTTLIWGRHDLATSLAVAQAASARYGWPLHVIEGAADDPAVERPAAFVAALAAALTAREAGVRRRGGDPPHFGKAYGGNPAANYERFFVPAIGAPLAADLVRVAALRAGERVLDVACGTGVVARLASRQVGATGTVDGLDLNPGMLAVARSATPQAMSIEWHGASAEAMPLPDASFDVALCQMGLQFMLDKRAALQEMQRVLVGGGRLILNVPGPAPRLFTIMGEALARHIGAEAAGFVDHVFSLHDTAELRNLVGGAGFHDVSVRSDTRTLCLPAPEEFLWQYLHSTPLAGAVAQVDDERRGSLERDVVAKWQEFVKDGALMLQVRIAVVTARK